MKRCSKVSRIFLCTLFAGLLLQGTVHPTRVYGMSQPPPSIYQANVVELKIAPSDSNWVYALVNHAEGVFLFVSSDGAASWNAAPSIPSPVNLQVDPADPRHLYVLDTTLQLHQSTDAGQTWTGITVPAGYENNSFVVSAASTIDLLVCKLYYDYCNFSFDQGFYILHSTDGGEHWTSTEFGSAMWAKMLTAAPGVPAELYVTTAYYHGSKHHLRQSVKGGQAWNWLQITENTYSLDVYEKITELVVDPVDRTHLFSLLSYWEWDESPAYRPMRSSLCSSTDHGASWSCKDNFSPLKDITIVGPSLFAVGGHRIYRSDNNGADWWLIPVVLPDVQQIEPDPAQPGKLLVGSATHGVLISTDWGLTWQWNQTKLSGSTTFLPYVSK